MEIVIDGSTSKVIDDLVGGDVFEMCLDNEHYIFLYCNNAEEYMIELNTMVCYNREDFFREFGPTYDTPIIIFNRVRLILEP